MPTTVFLADDHPIVRKGLRALVEAERDLRLVGEAGDGPETVRLVERHKPDVLVLDLMMPGLNGFEAAKEVRHRSPRTAIVVLSMHSDLAYVVEAIRAGASAYVLKDAASDELVRAIRSVLDGERFFSPPLSAETLENYMQKTEGSSLDPFQALTLREREVMQLTAEGLSGPEIAQRLHISPRTVESHRANLMRKLGVRNLKELIRLALQRGTLPARKDHP